MKSHMANIGAALAILASIGVGGVFAQQTSAKRNFDAEIQAALESAKTAAGFEHLGTLVRTCLLPQSGGENNTDKVQGYIAKPASASPRDTWFVIPTKSYAKGHTTRTDIWPTMTHSTKLYIGRVRSSTAGKR